MRFIVDNAALWPVLVPGAAMAVAACCWDRIAAQRAVSRIAAVLMIAASALLLTETSRHDIQVIRFGNWPPPFGIVFTVDLLGASMAVVTAVIALAALVFSAADIRLRHERGGFHVLFNGLIMGVNGAFLTGDLFNLYVWFEVMLIAAIGLLVLGRTPAQIDGAFKYGVLNLLSTLLILTGVAILFGHTGTLNMADLARLQLAAAPSAGITIAGVLLLAGFGIKAGCFPLFFWLPASYHTAPMTIAAVFAGLLTKVGVYASFRVFTLILPIGAMGLREMVAVIAGCTMVVGVFGAVVQWDVRRILAFHIVSQIGYMLMGLAIATPAALGGAIFYIVHHIIVKANLFLFAGAMYRAAGTYDLRRCGGLGAHRALPAMFLIPALSLAGVPPFSGFWAKLLVIDAGFRNGQMWLGGVALFVGLMTLLSMSKIWVEGFWKPPARTRAPARLPAPMIAASALLAAITIALSLYPDPLMALSARAGQALADPAAYVAAVFDEGRGGDSQ